MSMSNGAKPVSSTWTPPRKPLKKPSGELTLRLKKSQPDAGSGFLSAPKQSSATPPDADPGSTLPVHSTACVGVAVPSVGVAARPFDVVVRAHRVANVTTL